MDCPHCDRLLYERQHKTCGYCGGELPPELRLSEVEIAKLKAEKAAIAERRAKAKAKDEEEKKKRDEANRG
jgi:hypothetical protein